MRTQAQMRPGAGATEPSFRPPQTARLQRECACGSSAGMSGDCEKCGADRLSLRRSAANQEEPSSVPPIVHDVLRSPGKPLDAATRTFFEPRFGYDFSRVRVHADPKAAESARTVNALAYTVGADVVFGEGLYAPGTAGGRRLMAHELTHVVQQRTATQVARSAVSISAPTDNAEREAESVARGLVEGQSLTATRSPLQMARADAGPQEEKGPSNHAKDEVSPTEKDLIVAKTKAVAPTGKPMAFKQGPGFVLHDTAGRATLSPKDLQEVERKVGQQLKKDQPTGAVPETPKTKEELKKKGQQLKEKLVKEKREEKDLGAAKGHQQMERGPLDYGVAVWVPTVGEAIVARPFFDSKRPTTTAWEKREDKIGLADREETFQKIWKATNSAEQTKALKGALDGLGISPKEKEKPEALKQRAISERKMTPDEVKEEQSSAGKQLQGPLLAEKTKEGTAQIWTTAAWAIGEICEDTDADGEQKLAASEAQAKDLKAGCDHLKEYFQLRDERIGSTVNVEIFQDAGSQCRTEEPKTGSKKPGLVPLDAYTETQYQNTALVYLQASLQAGRFLEITTHFLIDEIGHCDPRCFRLQHLYDLIADTLHHPKGSTYGVKPSYGLKRGTDNVWWQEKVCKGPPPSAG